MSELFGVRATKEANNGKQDIKWKQVNPVKKTTESKEVLSNIGGAKALYQQGSHSCDFSRIFWFFERHMRFFENAILQFLKRLFCVVNDVLRLRS